jgi:cyclic pyranopterin monophosphate synthase
MHALLLVSTSPCATHVFGGVHILQRPRGQIVNRLGVKAIKQAVNRDVLDIHLDECSSQSAGAISGTQALSVTVGIDGDHSAGRRSLQPSHENLRYSVGEWQIPSQHHHMRGLRKSDAGRQRRQWAGSLGRLTGPQHLVETWALRPHHDDPVGASAGAHHSSQQREALNVQVELVRPLHAPGSASGHDDGVKTSRPMATYAGVMPVEPHSTGLSHIDQYGRARMVDVSDKDITTRTATASGFVRTSGEVVDAVRDGSTAKGDVIGVARLAGIMGAKRTSELIPLCHPLSLNSIDVDVTVEDDGLRIWATARTSDRTGVEMEALTAVAVAGLTVIDMVKALDPEATLDEVRVESKEGGRSGTWNRVQE